jgi:pyridoxine kinase
MQRKRQDMKTSDRDKLTNQTPKVLAIHDLSGHSHTSLMAVIPVMSRQGISVTALPTAVLSTNTEHTGFVMADLTPHLAGFLKHWQSLKLSFDAIYSGFLSNGTQVEIVSQAIGMFKRKATIIVTDPVMGDNGSLYPCFDQNIVRSMRKLVSLADLITPNLTEAAFLLNEPYRKSLTPRQAKDWCKRLSALGPGKVLITNVPTGNAKTRTSVFAYEKATETFRYSTCQYLPVNYPGTGDIFTSVLLSLQLNGSEFFGAVSKTVRFLSRAINLTMEAGTPPNDGIALEKVLKLLN